MGYQVKELSHSREQSFCCGGGGGLVNNNPELSEKICQQVLSEIPEGASLTSPCPMCYFQFKKYANHLEVKEFSEIILEDKKKG